MKELERLELPILDLTEDEKEILRDYFEDNMQFIDLDSENIYIFSSHDVLYQVDEELLNEDEMTVKDYRILKKIAEYLQSSKCICFGFYD